LRQGCRLGLEQLRERSAGVHNLSPEEREDGFDFPDSIIRYGEIVIAENGQIGILTFSKLLQFSFTAATRLPPVGRLDFYPVS